MACCGAKRARRNPTGSQAPIAGVLPGTNGIIKVEYLGKDIFAQRGAATGVYYQFGPDQRLGYVDKGDAATLLELSENGNALFKNLGMLNAPKPPPEVSSVVKGIGADVVRKRARKA